MIETLKLSRSDYDSWAQWPVCYMSTDMTLPERGRVRMEFFVYPGRQWFKIQCIGGHMHTENLYEGDSLDDALETWNTTE